MQYYESEIKQRLLRYATSALLFSESRVNPLLISWNRGAWTNGAHLSDCGARVTDPTHIKPSAQVEWTLQIGLQLHCRRRCCFLRRAGSYYCCCSH